MRAAVVKLPVKSRGGRGFKNRDTQWDVLRYINIQVHWSVSDNKDRLYNVTLGLGVKCQRDGQPEDLPLFAIVVSRKPPRGICAYSVGNNKPVSSLFGGTSTTTHIVSIFHPPNPVSTNWIKRSTVQ